MLEDGAHSGPTIREWLSQVLFGVVCEGLGCTNKNTSLVWKEGGERGRKQSGARPRGPKQRRTASRLSFQEGVGQAGPYNGEGNSHLGKVLGQRANFLEIDGNGGEFCRNSLKSFIVLLCPKADIANCEVVEHSQTA